MEAALGIPGTIWTSLSNSPKNALLEGYERSFRNKEYVHSYFMYKILLKEKLKDTMQVTKVQERATKQLIKQAKKSARKAHRTLEIMVCVCGFYHTISPLIKCHLLASI